VARGSGKVSIVVVGGPAKGVGKTALICGIIAAMPEREWTAIKVSSHAHAGNLLTEQVVRDPETDTGRYLLAGARRALLAEAPTGDQLALLARAGWDGAESIVFESNRIGQFLTPDLCLGVLGENTLPEKPSFAALAAKADGLVARTGVEWPARYQKSSVSLFAMDDFGRISPKFAEWVRERLSPRAPAETARS
jgi:hypothetical protein